MNKIYVVIIGAIITLSLISIALVAMYSTDIAVLNPKGIIAIRERDLMVISTLLMLLVAIPVFVMTVLFAWKFRKSNKEALYSPNWDYNFFVEAIWWTIPLVIVLGLSIITWRSSHELDPFRPLESDKKPITIQVVALQWKWLFIYPEQDIATVNFFQFPEQTPIRFEITADAPMNSFWIPQLSGQVYAMPGMRTKLHIIANETGDFRGSSANLSGKGFARMKFIAKSTSEEEFNQWVESVRQSAQELTQDSYIQIAKPSEEQAVESFRLKREELFDWIVMKYMMPTPS